MTMNFSAQTLRDLGSGVVAVAGIVVALVGAELALPVVAGVGAAATVGAGVVSVLSSPKSKQAHAYRDKD
jgi:hypothetical protein